MKNFFPEETETDISKGTEKAEGPDRLRETNIQIFRIHHKQLTITIGKERQFFKALAKLSINSN